MIMSVENEMYHVLLEKRDMTPEMTAPDIESRRFRRRRRLSPLGCATAAKRRHSSAARSCSGDLGGGVGGREDGVSGEMISIAAAGLSFRCQVTAMIPSFSLWFLDSNLSVRLGLRERGAGAESVSCRGCSLYREERELERIRPVGGTAKDLSLGGSELDLEGKSDFDLPSREGDRGLIVLDNASAARRY